MKIKLNILSLLFVCGVAHSDEVETVEVPLEMASECAELRKFLEYQKNRSDMQMLTLVLKIKESLEKGDTDGLKQFSEIMLKEGNFGLKEILTSETASDNQKKQAKELLEKLN